MDSGTYYAKAGKGQIDIPVTVKALFRRQLEDVTIMEGLDVHFECETEEEYCHVQWFYDDKEIIYSTERMKIDKSNGRLHTLTVLQSSLEDSGKYSIRINDRDSIAELEVKEMPESIKEMSVHDIEEFLKAAKSGIKNRYNIRVMIVGENSVGKTCLLRRLMNEQIEDVISTDGINIERRKCQVDINTGKWHFFTTSEEIYSFWCKHSEQLADCGFWDFAGQKEFYATHQTFLSTNAVYLLVVDISKDLTEKTYDDMIEKEFDCIGEYIDFWLDNIHCYSRGDKNTSIQCNKNDGKLNPPVIIVGTGIDKIALHQREKREKNFEDHLSNVLSDHAKRRHLRQPHYLSNTLPSDNKEEFKRLRKDIVCKAKDLTDWGDNLPTRWIVLEKEIYRKIKEEVISYDKVVDLATMCSFPNVKQSTTELDSFLKYEHDIGNIIFFEDLKSFIVLDPEWLVNVFRCFVSHQYRSECIFMTEWAVLEETGKLLDNLIENLLKKVPSLRLTKHKDFVLQVMEKFDIIVKPINNHVKRDFYMPCMIKPVPFDKIIRKSGTENCKRTSWFCLEFSFLPPSFFNHILVSFVKSNKLLIEEDDRLSIYRNLGILLLNSSGSQILYICLSQNSIAMQVKQLNCSEQVCYSEVKNELIDLVHSMKQRYRINITYDKKFKCAEGIYHGNNGKIPYYTALENSNYLCPEHNFMHSSKEIYSSWLTDEEVEQEKHRCRRKCQQCLKMNMSMYWCYKCIQFLCKDCSRKHNDKNENHSIQYIISTYVLDCKFSVTGKGSLINDMKLLYDGLLILATDAPDQEIMIWSVSGKQKQCISVNEGPKRIVVVDRNTVAVSLEKNRSNLLVAIIDIHQRHIIEYINIKDADWQSQFIYIENQLYVAVGFEIIVTDMSGTVKRRIQLGFKSFCMCYDVGSKRIYCIDMDNSKLVGIDRYGNENFTFPHLNQNQSRSLTIDNEGDVLLMCNEECNNSGYVIKVRSKGKSSEIVITNLQMKSFFRDCCICFHRLTNSLVVSEVDTVYICTKRGRV